MQSVPVGRLVSQPVCKSGGWAEWNFAPLSPHFYHLDENGAWKGVAAPKSKTHIAGYRSTLIALSDGRWVKKLLAVYLRNGTWMIYDGEQEVPLAVEGAQWTRGNFGRACLTLESSTANKSIAYLRPWLRLWFEGRWALDDIDIACLIYKCINDKAILPGLEQALEVANSEFGF